MVLIVQLKLPFPVFGCMTCSQDSMSHLVDGGGQVAMAADALDFWQVLVAVHQGLLVLMLLPFTRQQCTHLDTGLGLQGTMAPLCDRSSSEASQRKK